jgi:eukaryotic-like serine/threonine-protein kinase
MDKGTGRLLDNRYRLGPLVGRGGMATVHAATDTRLRRAVAIKLFTGPADELALARLEAEAKLLAGLSHPGLLRVFDVSTSSSRPYLVMQLVNGCTLRAMINRGPMEPAAVAGIGVRLARTLAYVHARQVVHRDIKPSNVLLSGEDCYLADFGIAKAIGSARLTASGRCLGTAAYLAPEQVAGEEAGPAADIYSLGLVLLECLTGCPEYDGTETEAALARLTRSPRVPEWVPSGLRTALEAMTRRAPEDRPDAAACTTLLEEAASTGPVRTVVAPAIPELRVTPTRLRLVAAAFAMVVAFGATLLLVDNDVPGSAVVPVQPAAPQGGAPTPAPGPQPQTAMAGLVTGDDGGQAQPQPQPQPRQPAGGDQKPAKAKGKGGHSGRK